MQQLVSDCDRQVNSGAALSIVSGLLNHAESTLSIVEEGINLLSASPLFLAECTLLSTFRNSLARCVRTLQYGQNDCTVPPVFVSSHTLFYSGYRGIDGYSHMIVYLQCATNNRSLTVFRLFKHYSIPRRVRSDKGGEIILVCHYRTLWLLSVCA